MPISPSQIRRLLEENKDAFSGFNLQTYELLKAYRQGWAEYGSLPLDQRLGRMKGVPLPAGARPLEDGAVDNKGVVRFPCRWANREEGHDWVRQVLTGITTFAVDGSQIFPSKDLSLPIALIQIGWFENPHLPTGSYKKDIRLEILTPDDLKTGPQEQLGDRRVNIRRFEMEIERLVEFMESCADSERCLVFFDGSLVVTFAETFDEESQAAYVQAMLRLLKASEQHRVPLVGYVDTSYAHDLTRLLHHTCALPETERIHDAQVINPYLDWGDRTPLYRCDRGGILEQYGELCDRIGFTYLKTTRDNYPVRLEIPLWLWEAGQLEAVLDWVRAEVVVGGGYPYAIETADQTAVLQTQDRQVFYRILQEWAEQESIKLRFSRKMVSKVRRR
ncbi:MAG: DNA double-strand break repair nuclease NurA [Cyanobacteria bacterium Co-bin13]|nr:DNA double-strand break repair nuclease NurA [Cyanobacteria bacterium Co-bin13]